MGLASGVHHAHLFALDERVGRVLNDLIAGAESGDDLHIGSVVFADDHRHQMRHVAVDHHCYAQSFLAEDQRRGRHDGTGRSRGRFEVHLGQRTRQQLSAPVIHIDFHKQGTAGGVDGVGGANQRSLVGFAGVLGEGQADLRACFGGSGIDLRQVGVDAQGLDGLQVEEFLAGAGVDELAGVDGAGGNDPVERRIDLLKRLQFAQPLLIGLGGADSRGGGRGLVHKRVGVLMGDGVGFDQSAVAVGLDARVVGVGLGGGQFGLGLRQLLVDLGSGDLGQQRALFHLGADVEVPARQVAGGARVDGGIGVGGHVAGEDEIRDRRTLLGRDGDHRGRGQLFGGVGQHLVGMHAVPDAHARQDGHQEQHHGHAHQGQARREGLLFGRGLVSLSRLRVRIGFVGHEKLLR